MINNTDNTNINSNRIFFQTHKPLNFSFNQNRYDFIVEEIPLDKFSNKGNYLILKIKKQFTSTWELLNSISAKLDIAENLIGYAGLKDKHATTTQYISIPLHKSREFKKLNSKYVEVLDTYKHHSKIKIGDLKGNRFKITLKEVDEKDIKTIYQTLSQIEKNGLLNYFGAQRFGKDNKFKTCKDIVYGDSFQKDKKLNYFLISSYQSYFFNSWLRYRVKLSKQKKLKKLEILDGDIFNLKDKKTITGLLPGRKIIRAKKEARKIEEQFDDLYIHEKGFRRDAIVEVKNLKSNYIKEENWLELSFELPSSSYATVLIETIANKLLS